MTGPKARNHLIFLSLSRSAIHWGHHKTPHHLGRLEIQIEQLTWTTWDPKLDRQSFQNQVILWRADGENKFAFKWWKEHLVVTKICHQRPSRQYQKLEGIGFKWVALTNSRQVDWSALFCLSAPPLKHVFLSPFNSHYSGCVDSNVLLLWIAGRWSSLVSFDSLPLLQSLISITD